VTAQQEFTSLWAEASRDFDREARLRAEATATVALGEMWPFFALARSKPELEHRKALARERLEAIAAETGLAVSAVAAIVDRHYDLLVEAYTKTAAEEKEGGKEYYVVDRSTGAKVKGPFEDRGEAQEAIENNDSGLPSSELAIEEESAEPEEEGDEGKEASLRHTAIPEGENILAETVNDPSAPYGAGAEKPPEHDDGPDENIPPEVRNKIPDAVATLTWGTHEEIFDLSVKLAIGEYVDPSQQNQVTDQNVPAGPGAQIGMQPEAPAMPGAGAAPGAPMGMPAGYPVTTKPRQLPGSPSGDMGLDNPMDDSDPSEDSSGQAATASRADNDPVLARITQVATAIRRDNPQLSETMANRVARKVVARMLTAAGDDGIDYMHPMVPKAPVPGGQQEEEGGGLAGDVAGAAGGAAVVKKVLPLAERLLPVL